MNSVAKPLHKPNVTTILVENSNLSQLFRIFVLYMYLFLFKGISLDQRDTLNISTLSGMENTQGSLKEARTMIVNQR